MWSDVPGVWWLPHTTGGAEGKLNSTHGLLRSWSEPHHAVYLQVESGKYMMLLGGTSTPCMQLLLPPDVAAASR
jgi:hypothetical protein